MKKLMISTLIAVATFNAHALDQSPTWQSIDIGYANMSVDDEDSFDPTGFKLQGEYLITDNIFLMGKYSNVSDDLLLIEDFSIDTTIEETRLGAGYRYPLSNKFDVYGSAAYYNQKTTLDAGAQFESDASGLAIAVGGKYAVTSKVELFGQIATLQLESSSDDEDFDGDDFSETEIEIGGRYNFNDNFGLVVSYVSLDDFNVFNFGGAYYF